MKKVLVNLMVLGTLTTASSAFAAKDQTVAIPENELRDFRVMETEEISAEEALEDATICRRQTICNSFGACFQRVHCVPTYRYQEQYEYYPW